MMVILYWIAGAALLASGWLASAWFYKRKIDFLNVQMRVMRQTATPAPAGCSASISTATRRPSRSRNTVSVRATSRTAGRVCWAAVTEMVAMNRWYEARAVRRHILIVTVTHPAYNGIIQQRESGGIMNMTAKPDVRIERDALVLGSTRVHGSGS